MKIIPLLFILPIALCYSQKSGYMDPKDPIRKYDQSKVVAESDFRNKDFVNKDLTDMKELVSLNNHLDPLYRNHFDGSNMEGTFMHQATIARVYMRSVNLKNADLTKANLTQVDFTNADLRDCNFEYSDIDQCDFTEAKLEGARFKGAWIRSVTWPKGFDWKNQGMWGEGVILRNTDFNLAENRRNMHRWRTRSMKGADISGSTAANWPYDQFYGYGMQDISAIGLDFSGNRYGGGMILSAKGGDFRNANFSKSPIHGCNFVGANLQGANLSGCRIWGGASFKRANLTGVNWKDATFDKSVSWPEGFDPSKVGLKLVD